MYTALISQPHVFSPDLSTSRIQPWSLNLMYPALISQPHVFSPDLSTSCIQPSSLNLTYSALTSQPHVSSPNLSTSCIQPWSLNLTYSALISQPQHPEISRYIIDMELLDFHPHVITWFSGQCKRSHNHSFMTFLLQKNTQGICPGCHGYTAQWHSLKVIYIYMCVCVCVCLSVCMRPCP